MRQHRIPQWMGVALILLGCGGKVVIDGVSGAAAGGGASSCTIAAPGQADPSASCNVLGVFDSGGVPLQIEAECSPMGSGQMSCACLDVTCGLGCAEPIVTVASFPCECPAASAALAACWDTP
jgi:hypothetical protein